MGLNAIGGSKEVLGLALRDKRTHGAHEDAGSEPWGPRGRVWSMKGVVMALGSKRSQVVRAQRAPGELLECAVNGSKGS